jgi:hypothetical protein
MALPPTSGRLHFLDAEGHPVEAPAEWTPALIEVEIDVDAWDGARLTLQSQPVPLVLRRLGGRVRVLGEWPRAGPGRYRLRLDTADGSAELVVAVQPRKITAAAYARLLEDLEARLPAVVALGLQRAGGLAGIALPPPGQSTLAQELVRLRRAVAGVPGRPGLAAVLTELGRDPHRVLRPTEFWVRAERARRPHPARLGQALARGHGLDGEGRPDRVLDARVDPTADVYENRLVRTFAYQVDLRLRRLARALEAASQPDLLAEARALHDRLDRARRGAPFLAEVGLPTALPTRTTMVLIRRPPYRAALEGFLEFRRSVAVRLEEPALEAPLENLPRLYQLWGTLAVVAALLDAAADRGYRVVRQQLAGRDVGVYVRVLPGGIPAVVLEEPGAGTQVSLVPERTYGSSGALRSISFPQRPDVAVEVAPPGLPPRVYLFDPKYKLDGELVEGETPDGRPRKGDVDKMHAYRDAIRDADLRRVVRYAATLYPGPEVRYSDGIEALRAHPGDEAGLVARLREVLHAALSPGE